VYSANVRLLDLTVDLDVSGSGLARHWHSPGCREWHAGDPMDLSHPKSTAPAESVACTMYQDSRGRWHWEAEDRVAAVV